MDPEARWRAVHDLVAAHRPADEREHASRSRMLAELERLPLPFTESADPVHFTASAVVVGARGTVLHRHRRMGVWLQPGGHIDEGEAPWDAAIRETAEETGLAASHVEGGPILVHLDVHDAPRGHVHLDLRYLLHAPDLDPAPGPGESPEARWFEWGEADAVADESLRNALRSAQAFLAR
jgi:8-oxo-dGTP pyrophosphatase MutT (NUDIX family)